MSTSKVETPDLGLAQAFLSLAFFGPSRVEKIKDRPQLSTQVLLSRVDSFLFLFLFFAFLFSIAIVAAKHEAACLAAETLPQQATRFFLKFKRAGLCGSSSRKGQFGLEPIL